jgi:hypothetical protein
MEILAQQISEKQACQIDIQLRGQMQEEFNLNPY